MRNMISVEEARNAVAPVETVEHGVKLTYQDIDVSDRETIKSTKAQLSDKAISALCSLTDIPHKFYEDCNPETKQAILKQVMPQTAPKAFKLISIGSSIDNIVLDEAVYHSPRIVYDTVAESLLNHGYKINGVMESDKTDEGFGIAFVTDKSKSPASEVGDVTHAGVFLDWSTMYTNNSGFKLGLGSYLMRLVCTNGMLSPKKFSFNVGKTNGDFKKSLEEVTLMSAAYSSTQFVDSFVDLKNKKIDNIAQFLNQLSTELKTGKRDLPDLIAKLSSLSNDATAYDIINLITEHANELDARDRRRLQTLGGFATESLSQKRCTTCHKIV